MTLVVSVNGTDLSSQKIFIGGTFDAWHSAPVSTRGVINLPNRVRGVLSRSDQVASRALNLPIYLNTNTLADRQTAADYLKGLHRQSITLKLDDGTTARELIGTIVGVSLIPNVTANNVVMRGTLAILAGDPLWRATAATTVGSLNATPTTLVLGTGPVEDWTLDITVSGGSDARTITVTIGGTVSYSTAWTGTIGGNTLHLNADLSSVLNNVTNAISGLVGGFPAIDPANGTVTIAVSSSSGTAAGTLVYRKKYY